MHGHTRTRERERERWDSSKERQTDRQTHRQRDTLTKRNNKSALWVSLDGTLQTEEWFMISHLLYQTSNTRTMSTDRERERNGETKRTPESKGALWVSWIGTVSCTQDGASWCHNHITEWHIHCTTEQQNNTRGTHREREIEWKETSPRTSSTHVTHFTHTWPPTKGKQTWNSQHQAKPIKLISVGEDQNACFHAKMHVFQRCPTGKTDQKPTKNRPKRRTLVQQTSP